MTGTNGQIFDLADTCRFRGLTHLMIKMSTRFSLAIIECVWSSLRQKKSQLSEKKQFCVQGQVIYLIHFFWFG